MCTLYKDEEERRRRVVGAGLLYFTRGCFVERGLSSAGFFASLLARREILSVLYDYSNRATVPLVVLSLSSKAVRLLGLEV